MMNLFATTVRVNGIKPELLIAVNAIADYNRALSTGKLLMITSLCDGKHSRNSLHYVGYALDCDFMGEASPDQVATAFAYFKRALTTEYDVVAEYRKDKSFSHFHIEFQPETNMRV